MTPLIPKLLIAGFFGLIYGVIGYFVMLDLPDAPRWGVISGLLGFALLLLGLLIRDDVRTRRYQKAAALLPAAPRFRAGAHLRENQRVMSVTVCLCGDELIFVNVEKRKPMLIPISRSALRRAELAAPVELRLETADGRRFQLLSPYMEELTEHLRRSGWLISNAEE